MRNISRGRDSKINADIIIFIRRRLYDVCTTDKPNTYKGYIVSKKTLLNGPPCIVVNMNIIGVAICRFLVPTLRCKSIPSEGSMTTEVYEQYNMKKRIASIENYPLATTRLIINRQESAPIVSSLLLFSSFSFYALCLCAQIK